MTERIGQELGSYRLVRLIGRGGFSDVYLAEHLFLERQAAIKMMHTRLTEQDGASFLREARIISTLDHPNIIQILDVGLEDELPFLVMTYAPNGNLRQRHPKGSRLAPKLVVSYVSQVASALQYAHDKKLIHRDVKPENMLVAEDDRILLSDFGIALANQDVTAISQDSASLQEIAGTLVYMAPEQFQGKPRSASDQYSLGILVYEWLCGERPFQGSFAEIAMLQVLKSPPSLREQVADIPSAVEAVVSRALAKDYQERFPSIEEFALALAQAFGMEYTSLIPSGSSSGTILAPPHQPLSISPSSSIPTKGSTEGSLPTPNVQEQLETFSTRVIAAEQDLIASGSLLAAVEPLEQVDSDEELIRTIQSSAPSSLQAIAPPIIVQPPDIVPPITPYLGTLVATFRHPNSVQTLSWSPKDSAIVAASQDRTAHIWQTTPGKKHTTFRTQFRTIHAAAWSPEGDTIVLSGDSGKTRIYDAHNGRELITSHRHAGDVYALAWSPQGTVIASGGSDRTVQLWNQTIIYPAYTRHSDWVRAIAWSPTSSLIASGGNDKTIHVWSVENRATLFEYKEHSDWVRAIAWSPDGQFIASGGNDKLVHVWEAASGKKVYEYREHSSAWLGGVLALAWSPDGRFIASASEDSTVHVWRPDGTTVFIYRQHTSAVNAVSWSPTGKYLASASNDRTVHIWLAY